VFYWLLSLVHLYNKNYNLIRINLPFTSDTKVIHLAKKVPLIGSSLIVRFRLRFYCKYKGIVGAYITATIYLWHIVNESSKDLILISLYHKEGELVFTSVFGRNIVQIHNIEAILISAVQELRGSNFDKVW
jgi:hypothetical protein